MNDAKFTVTPVADSVPHDNEKTGLESTTVQEFIDQGLVVKHQTPVAFIVKAGFTRLYPNLIITDDLIVEVEDDGELIVL